MTSESWNSESWHAISPLDGRYHHMVDDCRPYCSEAALIKARLKVEITWLICLCQESSFLPLSPLSIDQLSQIQAILNEFNDAGVLAIKSIEATIQHDVKAVEYYLREKIVEQPDLAHLAPYIHIGCTSEDINNLAYAMMFQQAQHDIVIPALENLEQEIAHFVRLYAETPMLGRTHGQPASPTTVGKEWGLFLIRLTKQRLLLQKQALVGKCNGAVGNYNAHVIAFPDADWEQISQHTVEALGLEWLPYSSQINPHDDLVDWLQQLNHSNRILQGFCRDLWRSISLDHYQQKHLSNEVGSSTMPHKINPIWFENAEANLGIGSAIATHLCEQLPMTRWQRDLCDSTRMRNIGVVIGHSVLAYRYIVKGIARLSVNQEKLQLDLSQHPEILAEAIQTVLRREGYADAYERLKQTTRGLSETGADFWSSWITDQTDFSPELQAELLALSPEQYLGLAAKLAHDIYDWWQQQTHTTKQTDHHVRNR